MSTRAEDIWLSMVYSAHQRSVTDIHLNPIKDGLQVYERSNGDLSKTVFIDINHQEALMNYLKMSSGLNMALTHQPQEGIWSDGFLRARLCVCPMADGERVAIRLYQRSVATQLDELGVGARLQTIMVGELLRETGLIIIAGPTGSGKTTLLYAWMRAIATLNKHVVSLEQPVEQIIPDVSQMQPNSTELDLWFQAMMRQDPDVLVFGELRDASSINMALELSQTGHLVLATLHAGSQQDVEQRLGHPETLKFLMLLQVLHNHQNGLNLQVFDLRTSPWSSLAK